ncbi:MAG: hypothetical protein IKX33_01990 [Prevotella sp.]|nr:hypothetical protein [Prevotella sp.]
MKKISYLILMAIAVTVVFTSCERDYYYYDDPWYDEPYYDEPYSPGNDNNNDEYLISMASVLRGQWNGTITTDFYDVSGIHRHETYKSDFQFDQYDNTTINGRGREIDYAENDKEVYRCTFTWYIDKKTEDICLKFDDDREMIITSFHLDDNSFYGTMESKDGQEVDEFNLKRYTFSNKGLTFDVE